MDNDQQQRRGQCQRLGATLLAIALIASGCATSVGVSRIDPQTAYRLHSESALSEGKPSDASLVVLRRLGLLDRFETQPAAVLAELHRGLPPEYDDNRLFALAELSFLHGARTGDRAWFLASSVYAYALLFPGAESPTRLHQSDPRLRLAYDIYNEGLAHGLAAGSSASGSRARGKRAKEQVRLEAGARPLPFGQLELAIDQSGFVWSGYTLERFVSTATFDVRGLRNRYRRPGIGLSLAASLSAAEGAAKGVGAKRIGPYTKVPVTALVRFDNVRRSLVSGQVRGDLELYAADQASTVSIDGQTQPLESDPTAALAAQLDSNPLYDLEIAAFLRAGAFGTIIPRDRTQDGLFTLQPYTPGQIPVVLVHGTASSPTRWAELINELEGDRNIRERYQIWIFLYDTGNPVGYSAGRLRAALTAAVQEFDPERKDEALRRMVVIGHSQGGLLTKLTAIDTGTRLWDRVSSKPIESLDLPAETRDLLKQSMFFTPLPFVKRVIFVATPHRGAMMAGGRIGAFAGWLVNMPTQLLGQLAVAATSTADEKLAATLRRPPSAIENMNPNSPGVKLVSSIPVPAEIPAHSIIAVKGRGPASDGNDGVVAYKSAHLDEAASELVVRWNHSCQGQPETIEEIRRILVIHASVAPAAVGKHVRARSSHAGKSSVATF